ncbi:MAG: hypothetical protein OEU76_09680 [Cyclobacteriaceae bacterium]|nr:hypothetical protein [Cyclobacteriaceae bacterium]
MKGILCFLVTLILLTTIRVSFAQTTQIRGFADVLTRYDGDKVSFGFDEQDLFITSTISDRISFLGETVFKYDPNSATEFSISVERLIINYNLVGNHNIIMGKIHTPVNYWNDTYHHGRVFYPTIDRPLLFAANIIPIHTAGVGIQANYLGNANFGYDFFVGNGIGSDEIKDNDSYKSITAAIHIRPADRLKMGVSWYNDVISAGAHLHDGSQVLKRVNQNLFTGSISRFGKKFEFLVESTAGFNKTDSTGTKTTMATYAYAGVKLSEKVIPYVRYDNLHYQEGELYYHKNNSQSYVMGIRYEFNYLAVVKLEYQFQQSELKKDVNMVTAQFAVGF